MDPILYSLDMGVALADVVVEEPVFPVEDVEDRREAA